MTIGDARFFARSGPHPLAAVAEAAGGAVPEADLLLTGIAPLHAADAPRSASSTTAATPRRSGRPRRAR